MARGPSKCDPFSSRNSSVDFLNVCFCELRHITLDLDRAAVAHCAFLRPILPGPDAVRDLLLDLLGGILHRRRDDLILVDHFKGRLHRHIGLQQVPELLETVGIPANRSVEYPHQFSGGMKQRVVIAMALACNPKLLIADEPTTALDVTIQAQVLDLINDLKKQYNTSVLLITHDLGIVAETCDDVAIMYAGEIVEYGSLEQVFNNTKHPYTLGLFGSIPSLTKDVERLSPILGLMPDPAALPDGCKFHERCKYACENCKAGEAEFVEIEPGHFVRCTKVAKGEI